LKTEHTVQSTTSARTRKVRKVGRPRQNGEVSANANPREDILKAAASLFSLKGYAGTTMAEIADAVGIRSPSLYYHFSDKADVLRALASVGLSMANESMQGARKASNQRAAVSIGSRLYQLLHELVLQLRSSPYQLTCLFDPAFHTKEFADVNRRIRTWMKDVEAIIRSGVEAGDFVTEDAAVAAHTLRGLVESAIRELGGYKTISPGETADYIANFALRALLRDHNRLGRIRSELGYAP